MRRVLRASLVAVVLCGTAAAPLAGQAGDVRAVSSRADVLMQTIDVPVFPGQLVTATVSLPRRARTPVPAVLILSVREPGSAPAPAALATGAALLEAGVAVVQLELPPAPADPPPGVEPMAQPADDAYAVLQFVRDREDIDGDRLALVGIGVAAPWAARAAALDEAVRALVLLGAGAVAPDTLDLRADLPLLSLPIEARAAPERVDADASPAARAASFLTRQLR